MSKIEFDYNPWDRKSDVALENPGQAIGFAAVNSGLFPGRAPTVRQGAADATIGPTIQAVIELLAGSLEWCREYGLSAQEVQSKVRAFMENNRGSRNQQLMKAAGRDIYGISDPDDLLRHMNKNVVIPVER